MEFICNIFWKAIEREISRDLKIFLSFDSVIPPLVMASNKIIKNTIRDVCARMFMEKLITAKQKKQNAQ